MDNQKKYKVASEQLGEALWRLGREVTNDWHKSLYKEGNPEFEDFPPLSDETRQTILLREMLIINLWIISDILGLTKKH